MQTFADWGVDHVGVDNCQNGFGSTQSVLEYKRFHDALVKVGHPMVFGIWSVGWGKPWAWAAKMGHYYRTAGDLENRWGQDPGDPDGASVSVWALHIMNIIHARIHTLCGLTNKCGL